MEFLCKSILFTPMKSKKKMIDLFKWRIILHMQDVHMLYKKSNHHVLRLQIFSKTLGLCCMCKANHICAKEHKMEIYEIISSHLQSAGLRFYVCKVQIFNYGNIHQFNRHRILAII